jgi:hypothetical protein
MRVVGIRELKNRLSEYIRLTRAGERLLVTDRGVIVAELREPGTIDLAPGISPGLVRLIEEKRISMGSTNSPDVYPHLSPLLPDGQGATLLDEERGDH